MSTKEPPSKDVEIEIIVRDSALDKAKSIRLDIGNWFLDMCVKSGVTWRYTRHPDCISEMLRIRSESFDMTRNTQLGDRPSESADP